MEVHLVVTREGLLKIQIVGPTESHIEGHDLYFSIIDLVRDFEESIKRRFEEIADAKKQ